MAYEDFISKTTSVIDKLAPEKKVRIKGSNQEWFDNEIHEAISNRDKLFSTFKKTRLHSDNLNYNRARNFVQRLIKKKKKEFVTGQLEQNIGKPKDLWKTLKSMGLSAKSSSDTKICLKDGEELSFDSKTNANTFCSFYSNLAGDLLKKLPTPPKKFGLDTVKLYYQNRNIDNLNFTLNYTTEEIVLKILQGINTTKAAGLDKVAGKFLKDGSSILVTPITEICNLSIKLLELNPGPTRYPCAICEKGVRSKGVCCTNCGFWVHPKCEKISNIEYKKLSKIPKEEFTFTCSLCRDENTVPGLTWDSLPFCNENIDEATPDEIIVNTDNINLSIEDKWLPFKKRGLHFVHLNINSLLSKIDELREIAKVSTAAVIGITESKLDNSVLDGEINIEGYNIIRSDRNRHGGGVACYIRSDISYNIRNDFTDDIENIFFDILLPKLRPILIGIVYRPPDQSGFLDKLSSSIANAKSFDLYEAYILGDFNINLISKNTVSNSSKRYKEFCTLHGLKQLIESPTRVTENTSSLLDHILTNSHDKISQAGVIDAGLSDHQITYCTRKIIKEKFNEHKDITIRSLKNYSEEAFVNALREVNFPNYFQFTDVNVAYEDFISKTTSVINWLSHQLGLQKVLHHHLTTFLQIHMIEFRR